MKLHIDRTTLKTVLVMVAILLLGLLPVVLGRDYEPPRVEEILDRLQEPLPQCSEPQSRGPSPPATWTGPRPRQRSR